MQVLFHGIDVVEVERIAEMLRRHEDRFLERVFTPAEQAYARRHRGLAQRLAGRFAVKEAVLKLLGTGWRNGLAWTDIETTNNPMGRPVVRLTGEALRLADEKGVDRVCVSITHAAGLAIASVVALGRCEPPD